jgi:protease-4
MKKIILALFLLSSVFAFSQENTGKSFISYYELSRYMPNSPGSFKFGLYGFQNPALLNYNVSPFDMVFTANDFGGDITNFNDWGLFYGAENSGFGALTTKRNGRHITDYRYSIGFGDEVFGLGAGYGFSGENKSFFGRSNIWQLGTLIRPTSFLSIGATYLRAIDNDDAEGVVEMALRPVPNYPYLTLYGDMAIFDDQNIEDARWSAGAVWEFVDGIRVNGRYFSDESFSVGFDISLGTSGFSAHTNMADMNDEYENAYNSYTIRLGGKDRTIFDDVAEEIVPFKNYAILDLNGSIKYQRYQWFDNSKTLLQILNKIEEAKENDLIQGIVINTSGMRANMSILWEVRNKLKEFKEETGKKVIMFIDRVGIVNYHFASIGDEIYMDQMGTMSLEGFILGRSFYKNMLANLDIGFEELRFFKYKSAVESYSREDFSEGNEEQLQKLVDDWYETARKEICEARDMTFEEFDALVDNQLAYMPDEAIEKNLVDKKGRWVNKEEILKEYDEKFSSFVSLLKPMELPDPIDDKWSGSKSNIAVIYAIGECAMDQGIKARSLVAKVKSAVENKDIDAIVIRVDSPGGDAMASDYIAEVIRENKDKKPIIVSQGMLAASGGYWLSMYGDQILASPFTITGSIGVISGWFYDKGAADSLGITTDFVKRGEYADLGFSWSLPFIGLGLPVRNLTENEKEQRKDMILDLYEEFVEKVAEGRDMEVDEVKEVAQGRVWTGTSGLKNGLVDKIGGLDMAIDIAKREAGIDEDDDVTIYEYPEADLFNFASLIPSMIGFDIDVKDPKAESLLFRIENNGVPMPILPIDLYNYVHVEE